MPKRLFGRCRQVDVVEVEAEDVEDVDVPETAWVRTVIALSNACATSLEAPVDPPPPPPW